MQTFLWHPLTPKCTWLSQNKSKTTLRKYWENFFRNYARFYMQGVGIFTEITVQVILIFFAFFWSISPSIIFDLEIQGLRNVNKSDLTIQLLIEETDNERSSVYN